MQFGEFQLNIVSGGRFRIDGGTIFGVVPKVLWQRRCKPDSYNRVELETNCLLIQTGQHNILIDTGVGTKLNEKQKQQYGIDKLVSVDENLRAFGLQREDIDLVIFTHLHFDHVGGATSQDDYNDFMLTFPNAEHIIQRVEWETALSNDFVLRGAYPVSEIEALESLGNIRLIDGDVEIAPGIHARITSGHTAAHQSIIIESGSQTAIYLGDICPSTWHLQTMWCLAYDVNLLETRREKYRLLNEIAQQGWMAIFAHDPYITAAQLQPNSRRDFVCVEPTIEL